MTVFLKISVLFLLICGASWASPKKYPSNNDNFQPINRYYESNLPSNSSPTNSSASSIRTQHAQQQQQQQQQAESKIAKESSDRLRFGIPSISTSYGNTGSGVPYGNNGGGGGYAMSPMKIDVGGIALGALIGLGAILILPKIAHAFSGGYGYRSIENDMSALTDALARIDNSLEQHNIDSSSCMQRIICTYMSDAQKNIETGEATSVDQFVIALASNPLFSYMLDGTAIKQAVEMAKQGDTDKCSSLESKCPINRESIVKVIASLLPA